VDIRTVVERGVLAASMNAPRRCQNGCTVSNPAGLREEGMPRPIARSAEKGANYFI
jgi:hypothetical protein